MGCNYTVPTRIACHQILFFILASAYSASRSTNLNFPLIHVFSTSQSFNLRPYAAVFKINFKRKYKVVTENPSLLSVTEGSQVRNAFT